MSIVSGTVEVAPPGELFSGYAPPVGGQYRIISGASLTGVFNPVNVQSSLASVGYSTNRAWLTITNTYSPPRLASPAMSAGSFSFSMPTVGGQSYTVESSDDLRSGNWVFYTNFTGSGLPLQISIPVSGAPQRFFRVHQP